MAAPPRRPPPPGFTLRPYQRECLEAIRDAYKRKVRRQLVCLPTGTGKTVVFAQLPRFLRMKHRMLVLAHREELLEQARDKMLRANPSLRVEIEQGSRHASPEADVVIASVPTLGREGSARIEKLARDDFFLLVVDEAHHAVADTYRRILEHFNVFEKDSKRLLMGFTATPRRGDGQGLDSVFEEIVFSRDLPEMVHEGHLAPLAGWRVVTDIDLSAVKTRAGDYATNQLSETINVTRRNDVVVKAYQKLLANRPTICFCADVEHAESLSKAFSKAKIAAASVSGSTERNERSATLDKFRSGKLKVLTNCMVLTEGYDEPSIAGILLARPTKSALLYAQMVGRGTRLHPGKENVAIVDIVDATREHELVTLPTLFGLPASFDLKGKTTSEAADAFRWTAANRPWVSTEYVTSFDDLRLRCKRVELVDLQTPSEIGVITYFAWVRGGGENEHRLNLPYGERIDVRKNLLGEWEITLALKTPPVASKWSRAFRPHRDLRRVIETVDRFIEEERRAITPLIDRRHSWRKGPASDKQLDMLKRRGVAIPAEGLTRGQASHLISMVDSR